MDRETTGKWLREQLRDSLVSDLTWDEIAEDSRERYRRIGETIGGCAIGGMDAMNGALEIQIDRYQDLVNALDQHGRFMLVPPEEAIARARQLLATEHGLLASLHRNMGNDVPECQTVEEKIDALMAKVREDGRREGAQFVDIVQRIRRERVDGDRPCSTSVDEVTVVAATIEAAAETLARHAAMAWKAGLSERSDAITEEIAAIRELTPADARARLDAMLADAREQGRCEEAFTVEKTSAKFTAAVAKARMEERVNVRTILGDLCDADESVEHAIESLREAVDVDDRAADRVQRILAPFRGTTDEFLRRELGQDMWSALWGPYLEKIGGAIDVMRAQAREEGRLEGREQSVERDFNEITRLECIVANLQESRTEAIAKARAEEREACERECLKNIPSRVLAIMRSERGAQIDQRTAFEMACRIRARAQEEPE